MDTLQVVWARYICAFVLTLIVSNPFTHAGLLRTTRPVLQIGRSVLLLLSTVLNFLALRWLQLDEALSIIFATPFLVARRCAGRCSANGSAGGAGPRSSSASVGVLVVARPGFGGLHPAALLSLAGAICYARLRDHRPAFCRAPTATRPRCSMPTSSARW